MKTCILFFLVFCSASVLAEISLFGGVQVTGESGSGVNGDGKVNNEGADTDTTATSGLRFGAGAIRFGGNYKEEDRFAHIQLAYDGTVAPASVQFAYIGHNFKTSFLNKITLGKFKHIAGMEYNTPILKLDITKFDVLKTLQGGAVVGAKLGGDLGLGIGYELSVYNSQLVDTATTPNPMTTGDNKKGEALGKTAKLFYSLNDLYFQVVYSLDEDKRDALTGNYKFKRTLVDVGASYKMQNLTVKLEYLISKLEAETVAPQTYDEKEQTAYHAHLGYKVLDSLEAVVRYVSYSYKQATTDGTLTNLWLGANYWVNANERLQLNYVLAMGDKRWETEAVTPIKGIYDANALLMQYQISF